MQRPFRPLALLLGLSAAPLPAQGDALFETSAGPVRVVEVVDDLDAPWGVGFLPDGAILITERGGRLYHIQDGTRQAVAGLPAVRALGQGGLLDIHVPSDFAETREILWSYSEPDGRRGRTALATGRLSADGGRLEDVRVLFRQARPTGSTYHFGSRIVERPDGTLFLTIGDRGDRPAAQARQVHNGKIVRINRDGTIPGDNPFVAEGGAMAAVWSLGHRNPQGAALDADGRLWTAEHGAQGGDEVNQPEAGRNYGWPIISYGRHYSGGRIGVGAEKAGLEQPVMYWDPSIAPSGLTVYSGKLWPEWAGDLFVGSLKFSYLGRIERTGPVSLGEEERLFEDVFIRIRDVVEGPDGALYFLSVGDGALYRMTPAE